MTGGEQRVQVTAGWGFHYFLSYLEISTGPGWFEVDSLEPEPSPVALCLWLACNAAQVPKGRGNCQPDWFYRPVRQYPPVLRLSDTKLSYSTVHVGSLQEVGSRSWC